MVIESDLRQRTDAIIEAFHNANGFIHPLSMSEYLQAREAAEKEAERGVKFTNGCGADASVTPETVNVHINQTHTAGVPKSTRQQGKAKAEPLKPAQTPVMDIHDKPGVMEEPAEPEKELSDFEIRRRIKDSWN